MIHFCDFERRIDTKRRICIVEYSQEEYMKHYIIQALFKLMDEYTFEKITVTDIVNKAGVGRATFYRHFKTKEDVLVYFFNHTTREFMSEQRYYPRCKQDYIDITKRAFSLFKEQKEPLKLLRKAHLEYLYLNYLNDGFSKMFQNTFPDENKFKPLLYAGMLFDVSIAWLDEDCKTPIENLSELIIDAIYFKD